MPRSLSMTRKNIYRRNESEKVRMERIISGYLKYKHPQIYEEAYSFYNDLNELYPDKKDLRRCNEFEWLKTGTDETMRKYYRRKNYQRKEARTKRTDNMVLNIELMDNTAVENSLSPKVTQETAAEIPEVTQETAVEIPEVTQETAVEIPEVAQEIVVEPPMASNLLPVSDEELEEIINSLREDPDLSNFFDNIDYEIDDCTLW